MLAFCFGLIGGFVFGSISTWCFIAWMNSGRDISVYDHPNIVYDEI